MGWGKYFDFTDASIRGDPRWASATRAPLQWTAWAGPTVLTLLLLSIIQIILGVICIVAKDTSLTFGGVVQPLIVPGLSFFNTVPSAHLHIMARSNIPKMAIWFSSIMCVCYAASAIAFLASGCFVRHPVDNSLHRNECPTEDRRTTWDVMVALQLLSFVFYGFHTAMAVKVHLFHKKRKVAIESGTLVEEIDLDARAKREEEARQRWQKIVDL